MIRLSLRGASSAAVAREIVRSTAMAGGSHETWSSVVFSDVKAEAQVDQAVKPGFAVVLEEHGPLLLRFCRAHAGRNHGDDVFQETMLAALRAYDSVRDPAAIKSWLWSIAARKAIDAHRADARRATSIPDPEPPAVGCEPVESDIWDDVARLPTKQRQAVTLRFMADLSHREIAAVLQMNEAAVRRNIFEGLRRLRRELTPVSASEQLTKEQS